ncbi:hypothetical protein GUJ93_ZPchr0002g26366 [Zizania palustris]|uniref:C2H2-type domain-containing protein n=1 Tax=Zizania palustris TaxID=103762 RepID=A0A8J5S368_ZIZPA|nr:hypothetical protein GUJ93_ZPchr0002g26366 [Zizania palustris]
MAAPGSGRGAPGLELPAAAAASVRGGLYRCPDCAVVCPSIQALCDHLNAIHKNGAAPVQQVGMMVPLPPNPAFWEDYRRGGSRPVEVDFFRPPAVAAEQPQGVPNGNVSNSASSNAASPVGTPSTAESTMMDPN